MGGWVGVRLILLPNITHPRFFYELISNLVTSLTPVIAFVLIII
jgi:hypothetical protein